MSHSPGQVLDVLGDIVGHFDAGFDAAAEEWAAITKQIKIAGSQ